MPPTYEPRAIEEKWRRRWDDDRLYHAPDDDARPKWYALTMYPYPSGDLHIGHWYSYAPHDAYTRFMRMRGRNVMSPMGFDAFGLPAENAAIKHGAHPLQWTMANIERMRGQLRTMGTTFDWDREIVCCLPEYYRWNQWFFLKFYEKGLAYRAYAPANWCPGCQTVLANEQVKEGRCERSDDVVERRNLEQWFFRITDYAEELLDFGGLVDWPDKIKTMQRNWIGRSEGARLTFDLSHHGIETKEIEVFTTRPDTVFGVTFMALAPEHPLVEQLTAPERRAEVEAYARKARAETEIERMSTEREKTGVPIGADCVNPFNGERVPIYAADYVLLGYGTGAVMGVPAHDQRDFEFATKYGLPRAGRHLAARLGRLAARRGLPRPGRHGQLGALRRHPRRRRLRRRDRLRRGRGLRRARHHLPHARLADLAATLLGHPDPHHLLRRLRRRPRPRGTATSVAPRRRRVPPHRRVSPDSPRGLPPRRLPPLRGPARRETDTMDTFVDSSWYFLRYASPHYADGPFDPTLVKEWAPVDQYTGGAEHAVMHLLYARFFTKALRDLGIIDFGEPFLRLFNQGIILGEDHEKMSKSRGNVVNPDDVVAAYGADAVRAFLMFIGPWDQGGAWSPTGIQGMSRWLNRVWALAARDAADLPATAVNGDGLERLRHKTIRKVTNDLDRFQFNTALAALMEYSNELQRVWDAGAADAGAWRQAIETLIILLAPTCPHIAEELWALAGRDYSIHNQP